MFSNMHPRQNDRRHWGELVDVAYGQIGLQRLHPQRSIPFHLARETTNPNQRTCGGTVIAGATSFHPPETRRNTRQHKPPNTANPQWIKVTITAGTSERCAT